jgi:hypothetical protein
VLTRDLLLKRRHLLPQGAFEQITRV